MHLGPMCIVRGVIDLHIHICIKYQTCFRFSSSLHKILYRVYSYCSVQRTSQYLGIVYQKSVSPWYLLFKAILNQEGANIRGVIFFFAHLYFPASGQAVVTGVVPSPPRFLPSVLSRIGFSNPTARRFFIECC